MSIEQSNKQYLIINTPKEILGATKYFPGVTIVDAMPRIPQPNKFASKIPSAPAHDEPISISKLNTPVYSNLDIPGGSYTDNNGKQIKYGGIKIDTVLMTVNNTKNIVKTPVQGLDGTIKEYISAGDALITIIGVITGGNGIYPRDAVGLLATILNAPQALGVNSFFLMNLGIYNIVVESWNMPQQPGGYSQQAFEITASSDFPVELFIVQ